MAVVSSVRNAAIAFVGLNAVDAALTLHFVGNGDATEGNPLMESLLNTPELFWLVKIVGSALAALVLIWLNRKLAEHPRIERWFRVPTIFTVLIAGMVGICAFNLATILVV